MPLSSKTSMYPCSTCHYRLRCTDMQHETSQIAGCSGIGFTQLHQTFGVGYFLHLLKHKKSVSHADNIFLESAMGI
ncbi:hypothetical protein VTO42DRAFT_5970 [Malbranchea cinnamomea]